MERLFYWKRLSYDRFHEKADRIYRIVRELPDTDFLKAKSSPATPGPLAQALIEEIREVEHVAQITKAHSLIEYGDKRFYENGLYATQHFFQVFSFPLLRGDSRTALVDPNSIVVTESLARKFFGQTDPIGQTLRLYTLSSEVQNDEKVLKVTAVVQDPPANSHFSFAYLAPVSSSHGLSHWFDRWESNSYHTYASLGPRHSLPEFSAQLTILAEKYLSQIDYYKGRPDEIGTYYPQALTDIHLRSHLSGELGLNGDIKYVYLFSAFALLILVVQFLLTDG